jgi:ABC-type polysaccharide/polyol phosphate transport system ATPase subunit
MLFNNMNPSIIVDKVSKQYRIGTGLTNLRELLTFRRPDNPVSYHWAVKDVSFKIDPGESLGIIGPNGAGKTTILKMLSKVTKPTSGNIFVNGRFSALIELGAGFHPELTGKENIYLNGTILGMRRAEIKEKFDEIIDFAGIGGYLDTPVKRYSSGMYARLGFAIAVHVNPKVLLVDEVLAVGDYAFQMKCYAYMDKLRSQGTTIILVSHNFDAIRQVCDKGLVMYRGEAIFQGSSAEAVIAYSDTIRNSARKSNASVPTEGGLSQRVMTFDAEVKDVKLLNEEEQPINQICSCSNAIIRMHIVFNKDVDEPIFAFTIRTANGDLVYNTTTLWMGINTPKFKKGEKIHVDFSVNMSLLDGYYELGVDVTHKDLTHFLDRIERAIGFTVAGSSEAKGIVNLRSNFSYSVNN